MDDLWVRLERLRGQTLHTAARNRAFTIEEVSDKGLSLRLSTGTRVYSKREKVEAAYQLALPLLTRHPATPVQSVALRPASPRNHSYLLAIFLAIRRSS